MAPHGTFIGFDKRKLIELRKAYNKAIVDSEYIFEFDGQMYLTAYAKYLIDYLTERLG